MLGAFLRGSAPAGGVPHPPQDPVTTAKAARGPPLVPGPRGCRHPHGDRGGAGAGVGGRRRLSLSLSLPLALALALLVMVLLVLGVVDVLEVGGGGDAEGAAPAAAGALAVDLGVLAEVLVSDDVADGGAAVRDALRRLAVVEALRRPPSLHLETHIMYRNFSRTVGRNISAGTSRNSQ